MQRPRANRRVKGVNVLGLAKFLRGRRKTEPLGFLSPPALRLLEERILASEWYPFPPFSELVELTYREVLGENEVAALKMGVAGGVAALETFHKGFIKEDDPAGTLATMRAAWPLYFDFGDLLFERESDHAVRFTLVDYDDVTPGHAGLIVGWHVASAVVAGAKGARATILERPWNGGARLSHRITF